MNSKTPADAKWWAGHSEEQFAFGPYNTREEVLEIGRVEIEDGDGFWICHAVQQKVNFSASRLIDDQYWEWEGYFNGDEFLEPGRLGEHESADQELQNLLDTWVAKHSNTFVPPGLFGWHKAEFIPPMETPNERSDTKAMPCLYRG